MAAPIDNKINLVAVKNLTTVNLEITSDEKTGWDGIPLTGENAVPPGQVGNTGNMYIPDDESTGDCQIEVTMDDQNRTMIYVWRTSQCIYYSFSQPTSGEDGIVMYENDGDKYKSKLMEGAWVLTVEPSDDALPYAVSIQNMQNSQIYQDAYNSFMTDFADLIAAVPLGWYNYTNSANAIDIVSTVKDAYNGTATVTPATMDSVLNSSEMTDAMTAINNVGALTVSLGGSIMASYFVGFDLSVAFGYDFTDKEGLLTCTIGGLVGNQKGVSAEAELGIWFVKPEDMAGLTFAGLAGFSVPIEDSDVEVTFGVGLYMGFDSNDDFGIQGITFGTGLSLSLPTPVDIDVLVGWTFEKTL